MNPSLPSPQGHGMPPLSPAGPSAGMPMPPSAGPTRSEPPAGAAPSVPAVPDPALLPPAPSNGAPAAAANAAWLPPTVPVQSVAGAGAPGPQGTLPVPAVADDGDLIEKEWVHKVKEIVSHTRLDPHQQTKELHALKAEYMKKRYNKVIESVEE